MDSKIAKQLQTFIEFAAKELGLEQIPTILFTDKKEDKYCAFGHTKGENIHVRVTDRHPGDVMRTIAHELVHYLRTVQQDENVKQEDDANALAGRIMRKYNIKNPKLFKLKPIEGLKEDEGHVNAMGSSSSISGSGGIDMYDRLLRVGKMMRRKKLKDIIGSTKINKEINKDKRLGV